tara:strand:+ start:112 stop:522 length:411 start_codon:yes stop_codon:yes gene_type:complete
VTEQQVEISMVELESLRGHEEVIPSNLETRVSKMMKKGFYKPIVIDSGSKVILDGHHKWTAAKLLGLDVVPVIAVDYLQDDTVLVDVWPESDRECITKEEVLEMGISDTVFPPKTSRHSFAFSLPSISIPLDDLSW